MSGTLPFPGRGMPGRSAAPVDPPPLVDVLGAVWHLGAPVVGAAWDGAQAGFALGDGALVIARADWPGAARLIPRAGGGSELQAATQPPPPLSRLVVHQGACLALARDPEGGFLTGGDDGGWRRTLAEGEMRDLATFPGRWVDLIASSAAGWRACSTGRQVQVSGPTSETIELPHTATALAFDADGMRLAVAHYHGVTIWQADGPPVLLDMLGCPRSVAWSPDGAYLICGMQENALHGWRMADHGAIDMAGYAGQPRSLSFSADGSFLASSGAPSVVCWRFDPPEAGSPPMESGLPSSRLPVCVVACHPTHPLIAAGYHNGAVLLCQPGSAEVLFAKASSGGSVTALAWSDDGQNLAMGTEGGEVAVVNLPNILFRFETTETPSRRHAQ